MEEKKDCRQGTKNHYQVEIHFEGTESIEDWMKRLLWETYKECGWNSETECTGRQ